MHLREGGGDARGAMAIFFEESSFKAAVKEEKNWPLLMLTLPPPHFQIRGVGPEIRLYKGIVMGNDAFFL